MKTEITLFYKCGCRYEFIKTGKGSSELLSTDFCVLHSIEHDKQLVMN